MHNPPTWNSSSTEHRSLRREPLRPPPPPRWPAGRHRYCIVPGSPVVPGVEPAAGRPAARQPRARAPGAPQTQHLDGLRASSSGVLNGQPGPGAWRRWAASSGATGRSVQGISAAPGRWQTTSVASVIPAVVAQPVHDGARRATPSALQVRGGGVGQRRWNRRSNTGGAGDFLIAHQVRTGTRGPGGRRRLRPSGRHQAASGCRGYRALSGGGRRALAATQVLDA